VAPRRVAERSSFVPEGIPRRERLAPDGSLRNSCVDARWPTGEPDDLGRRNATDVAAGTS